MKKTRSKRVFLTISVKLSGVKSAWDPDSRESSMFYNVNNASTFSLQHKTFPIVVNDN